MPTRPSHDYISIPGTPGLDQDDSFTSDDSGETLFEKQRVLQPVRPHLYPQDAHKLTLSPPCSA